MMDDGVSFTAQVDQTEKALTDVFRLVKRFYHGVRSMGYSKRKARKLSEEYIRHLLMSQDPTPGDEQAH